MKAAPVVTLDAGDKALLNALQWDFPLDPRPYAVLGTGVGMAEEEVIGRVNSLRERHVIRQISAIFDSRQLGYKSSLVALSVLGNLEERAVEVVNAHPGVSHNYQRNHAFNMWYTLTIHPARDLEAETTRLAEAAGATSSRLLPTLRMYKINVKLDVTGASAATEREQPKTSHKRAPAAPLTTDDIRAIRELQLDLPAVPEPFAGMSERLGMPARSLLEHARAFLEDGRMRRFAAVLHHQSAGFTHNAMSVWRVPNEDDIDRCGRIIAGFQAVSHAYRRPTYPDWPYSLFGMIHGRSYDDCRAVADAIRAESGLPEYDLLFSTREWKKVRVQYFMEPDMSVEEMAEKLTPVNT